MRVFVACALGLVLGSCGDINVASDPATPAADTSGEPKSAEGENCTKTADCADDLKCLGNVCAKEGSDGGEPCGAPGCTPEMAGDDACNEQCNTEECGFDNGRCENKCRNPGDEAVGKGGPGLKIAAFDCREKHLKDYGAIGMCLETQKAVSPECTSCYVLLIECTDNECGAKCKDPDSPQCIDCAAISCKEPVYACSGLW